MPKAKVNYIYVFYLYGIATRYEERDAKNDVSFSSFAELEERITSKYAKSEDKNSLVSAATLRRIAMNDKYKDFFVYSKGFCGGHSIVIQNNFVGGRGKKSPFVVLNPKTYNFLIEQRDNLLAKYTIFVKYQCGRNGGTTDFTAN